MKRHALIAIITLGLLTACTHAQRNMDPTNINDLQNMSADSSTIAPSTQIGQIRMKALEDTALSIGAQGGLYWASAQINKRTEKDKWYLETIYNFNGMYIIKL